METKDLDKVIQIAELFKFEKIIWMVVAFVILVYVAKKLNEWTSSLIEKMPSQRLLFLQVITIVNFSLYIFGSFAIIYGILRPPEKMIIALAGSAAVAIGLALKDLVASIIAGIVLLFDRPFQVGDRVAFQGTYGEIQKIGLRAVRLNTLDDNLITIPNSQFMSNYVSSGNAGALDMMVVTSFHVAIDEDIDKIKDLLYEIVATSRFVYLSKPITISVNEAHIAESLAIKFTLKAYVLDVRYEKAFETDINSRVLKELSKNKIRRPYKGSHANG
ncbi:MAG: mechanosensitive ion channel family protein [Bacteriovoracaceae bacterium]|nr:mechanosensitive ion channel family protein [Bacteriovoracaceae bacterium]